MKSKGLNYNREDIIEFIALTLVYGFIFFTMFYADLTVTLQFSMTYIDSLFDGKFASFYNNALATGIAPEGAVYDVGIYFIFAIWGLPVYILNKLFHVSYLSVGSLLWFKLLLVVFAIAIKYVIEKIAEEIGIDAKKAGKWWLASPLMIFPALVAAQYDIVPVFFMLLGVLYAIRDEKVKYVLFFSFSFIMKPISLIGFVIVLLIKEKKIIDIIKYGILSVVPILVCKLIYMINPVNNPTNNDFVSMNLKGLFDVGIDLGNEKISLFILIFFLICAFCFIYKPQNSRELDGKWLVWCLYLVWLTFCIFTSVAPYWIIYMAPFIVLVSFYSDDGINKVLIMESIASIGFLLPLICKYTWVYGGSKTYSYLLLKNIYAGKQDVHTVAGVLKALGIGSFMSAIYAIVVGAFLVIAYKGYINLKDGKEENTGSEKVCSLQWWVKIAFLCAWCALTLLILFISK